MFVYKNSRKNRYLYLENIDLYRGNIIFFLVGHRTDPVGRYEALVSSEYVTFVFMCKCGYTRLYGER